MASSHKRNVARLHQLPNMTHIAQTGSRTKIYVSIRSRI